MQNFLGAGEGRGDVPRVRRLEERIESLERGSDLGRDSIAIEGADACGTDLGTCHWAAPVIGACIDAPGKQGRKPWREHQCEEEKSEDLTHRPSITSAAIVSSCCVRMRPARRVGSSRSRRK